MAAASREYGIEITRDLLSADPETMLETLAALDARYGSPVGYLADSGVEADAVDAIRGHLLEASGDGS